MVVKKRKAPEGDKIPVLQEDALLACLEAESIKEINAVRLWKWVIENPTSDNWDEVPWEALELPRKMKEVVPRHFVLHSSRVAERFDSADGTTTKLLVEMHDGERVEAVVMRHETRATLCVSSQVGCQMGCTFCATGTMGLRGNLSSAEILEQLLHAGAVESIRNVVFMGMGEPLHNYSSVLAALKAMTDQRRWSLRHGHITVSTVGVISNMRKLTRDMPNVSLALSLHGPTQAVREVIVPTAKAHPLPDLLQALDQHLKACKKKTSAGAVAGMIEYILIAGVNDSLECAEQLGLLLSKRNVMLNLIPYNDTTSVIVNKAFKAPTHEAVDSFQQTVVKHGVLTRVRREMGADIAGACGQLALSTTKSSSSSSSSNNNQHDDVNENFQRQRKGEEQEEEEEEERERQTTEKVNPVHNNDDDDGDKTTTRSTTPGSATTAVGAPLLDVVRLRPNSANHLYPEATYYAIAAVNLLLRMASPLLITSSLLYADGRHGEGFGLFGLSSAPSSFPHPCHGGNSGGGDDSSGGGSGADGADGADGGGGGGGSPSFPLTPLVLACALSVAEVCRRGLWNLLRLEHRHLAHCRERCARQTARLEHFYQSGGGGVVGNGCNANDRHSTPSSFLASVSSSSSSLVSPLSTPPRDTDTATAAATATQQDEDVEDNEGDDGDVFAVLTTTTPLFLSDEWLTAKLRQRAIGSSSSSSSSPHLDLCDNDNGDASNDEVRAFGSDGRSDGQSMTGRGLAGGGSEGSSDDGYERRRRYGGSDSGGGGGDEEGFVGGGGYGGDLGAQQQHQHQQQHRSRTAVDPDDDDFTPFNTNATSRQQQQQQNLNRQRTRSSRGRNSSGRNDYQWRQQPPRSSAFSSYRSSPPTDMNTDTARDGGAELAGAAESVTRGGLSSVVEEGTLRGRSTDTTVTLSDYNDEDDDEDETKDDDDDDDLDESGDFDDGFGV